MIEMKKSILLAIVVLVILLMSDVSQAAEDNTVCIVYFTKIGCRNCEVTDPVVLSNWPEEHDNLVVIEYMFYNWREENAAVLGEYTQKYGTATSVPQLFITGDKSSIGTLNVLRVEDEIKNLESNECLVDGLVSFNELDLNEVEGNPLKIWSNGRLLVRLEKNEKVSTDFLRELLFSTGLNETIEQSNYKIERIDAEPAPISNGQIEFGDAIEIDDSWILKFNEKIKIPDETNQTKIEIPFFGEIDLTQLSLPALTIILGLLDGFNPCAMFILCFLLVFLVGTKSRKKVFIIGGTFLFISGFVYFLFISAWFNFFMIFKFVPILKLIVGLLVVIAGLINIKDYFFFQKGISLTLPKTWKPKVIDKMKNLITLTNLPAMIAGVITIAFIVNVVELMCTFGFPMMYTQRLAAYNLSQTTYYLYILMYCIMYMIDDFILFSIAVGTLSSMKMTQKRVRAMKLISGILMIALAIWFVMS